MDVVPAKAEEWSVPPFSAEVRDGFLYGRGTLDTKGLGDRPLVRRAARREGRDPAEEAVPRGERGRGGRRGRGGGIFRAEPAVPDRRGVRDERGRRGGDRHLRRRREVLPAEHVGEGAGVDEAVRLGARGARQPSVGEGRPGAAGAGDGAGGGVPGAGAAYGAGPGHAAGAAREGVSRPRRRRPARRRGRGVGAGGPRAAGSPRSTRCCGTRSR